MEEDPNGNGLLALAGIVVAVVLAVVLVAIVASGGKG